MPYGSIKVDNIVFTNGGSDQTVTVSGLVASTSGSLTVTGTVSGNIIQGGTLVSGATVTGGVGQFTTLTGGTAGFTTITGTTVTGTTANFASGNFINISGGIYTITSGVFASGTAANPSFSFVGDSNTGIYASAVDQVSITTSGTERLRVDAAGQIEAVSLGSASAPTYSFTTDPNTGIYSPGADQLAISTNGTGRLFVDASGNVLVGAASAVANSKLLVANVTGNAPLVIQGGSAQSAALALYNNAASTNRFIIGQGYGSGSDNVAFIQNDANAALAFGTNGTERMRLDSSGRLGLGTSSPSQLLHIRTTTGTAGSAAARISVDGASSLQTGIEFYTTPSTSSSAFRSGRIYSVFDGSAYADSRITLQSVLNGDILSDTLTVKNGSVGIGTTSPGGILHTLTTSLDNVNFFERASGSKFGIYNSGSDSYVGTFSNTPFRLATNDVERARIDTSGRLLVGTSTSAGNAKLEVTETRRLSATAGGSGWLELTDSAAVTSGTLTDIATATLSSINSCYFRLEVLAGHTDGDGGYSEAVSIREGLISNYGGTPRVLNNTETRNLSGSVNAGVIATAVSTDAVTGTSGVSSTIIFRATATMSGSSSAGTAPRVSYRLSLFSISTTSVTAVSNI
jgi:hypothetical protein